MLLLLFTPVVTPTEPNVVPPVVGGHRQPEQIQIVDLVADDDDWTLFL